MTRRLTAVAVAGLFAVSCVTARTVRGYESASADGIITLQVDSIDFRKDLTRVYGRLEGRPHTSHRIDNASVTAGTTAAGATDIDGVDFMRYFQWEDNGSIPVEIDFPAMKQAREMDITLETVRGRSVTRIKKSK